MEPDQTTYLALNEADKAHLKRAAQWAKFIAIVNFIMVGMMAVGLIFMLLASLVAGASFAEMMNGGFDAGTGQVGATFWIIYSSIMLVTCAIYFFIALYAWRFANNTLAGLEGNATDLSAGVDNLRKYFKIQGVLYIIALSLIPLTIIGVAVAAIASAA